MGPLRPQCFARALALVAAAMPLPGCTPDVPVDCPDLSVVCPDVACQTFKRNSDGCAMCECDEGGEQPPCWDDGDCSAGQRCDSVSFCEQAPGCDESGPCPDACYGRCVDTASTCSQDTDCPARQTCAALDTNRPADDGGAQAPAPTGLCVDAGCPGDVAVPACPPGTEPIFDPGIDPCRASCVVADPCRDLLPEVCIVHPGCALFETPCACDGEGCDACAGDLRCASEDDCGRRSPETCQDNPNCVLRAVDDAGAEAPPCDANTTTCDAPPPPRDVVCVPRSFDGACLSDAECRAGEVCSVTTVCATSCGPGEDGSESCSQQCWTERGRCVTSDEACATLDPVTCASTPRCELHDAAGAPCSCAPDSTDCGCIEEGVVCRPATSLCAGNEDCPLGQSCYLVERCVPCDPSTGEDVGCAAPCFVEGRCVEGPPPPPPCTSDVDCERGSSCVEATVCETCEASADDAGQVMPCDAACSVQSVCKPVAMCTTDQDCPTGYACDPIGGTCRESPSVEGLCQNDDQCAAGQRCATELELCERNPNAPDSGCWSRCVDENGTYCLEDAACRPGERCAFSAHVCLDDPDSMLAVCSGWCVGACAAFPTAARDPATGTCVIFPDTCIPPAWVLVSGC